MLTALMQGFGHQSVELQVKEYTRYKSQKEGTVEHSAEYLREYLFLIHRCPSTLDLFS